MNTRVLLVSSALVCASFTGFAQADTASAQPVPSYHYGMPLHVGKVIALTEPTTMDCYQRQSWFVFPTQVPGAVRARS